MRRLFPASNVKYPAHTLCGCPPHPWVASTKVLAESEAPPWSRDFSPFRACLLLVCLLACCLLAYCLVAKRVRCTLDTKEGYKTKTSSTTLVTLTKIRYWDRAGGGRNIVYAILTTNEVRLGKWTRAAQMGLKMSYIHPFGHHNWTGIMFGKPWFRPIFEPLVILNWPIFKALLGLERGQNRPIWAQNGLIPLVCAPQIVQKYLWKDTFLIHF